MSPLATRLLPLIATLAAAACVTGRAPARPDCSNSPAHACGEGDECRTSADGQLHVCLPVPPRPEEMSPTAQRMMNAGRSVRLGSGPGDVARSTAILGPPALAFQSCTRAGCDETSEEGATSLVMLWHGEERDRPTLTVELCGRAGAWRVGHVSMNVTSPGGGAWGTAPRMRPVFAEMDEAVRKQCVR